ncbi:hypothetical protein [Snodgrassella alvi]|uniref:hypothetical protein n=1 Tax=Snodgrassella alvi TaxID=1196083 RepID=UPI00209C263C|nr:hypothetical protein [Snodgrassella alvi]
MQILQVLLPHFDKGGFTLSPATINTQYNRLFKAGNKVSQDGNIVFSFQCIVFKWIIGINFDWLAFAQAEFIHDNFSPV